MARMTIFADGRVLSFDVAELDSGPLSAKGKAALRPIESMGVDGREYQETGDKTDILTITTMEATTDFNREEARAYAVVGESVRIRYQSPTGQRIWNEALIVDVVALRRTGQLFGLGSRASAKNTLILQWTIDVVPEEV